MFALSLCGVASGAVAPMSLSGSLTANSTSGTVTSSTVTVTVPAGNSGVLTFHTYVDTGTITSTQYSRNGGAFTTIADGDDTVAFSNGDTIAVRTNGVGVGEDRAFQIRDKTLTASVQSVTHIYA